MRVISTQAGEAETVEAYYSYV